jgi:hypothetical protein
MHELHSSGFLADVCSVCDYLKVDLLGKHLACLSPA